MEVIAALEALSPEELLRVAEKLAPVIALIPSRCTTLEYRADGRQLVQFDMKLGGEWRRLGTYEMNHGISRTWIEPAPHCDLSASCKGRLHYESCGSAAWRKRDAEHDLFAPPAPAA